MGRKGKGTKISQSFKISQVAKFGNLRNFAGCEISQNAKFLTAIVFSLTVHYFVLYVTASTVHYFVFLCYILLFLLLFYIYIYLK